MIKFYSIPIVMPDGYSIARLLPPKTGYRFGRRHVQDNPNASGYHRGVDLSFPGCKGSPILAVSPGRVIRAEYKEVEGYHVVLEHFEENSTKKYWTFYCHLLPGTTTVSVGDVIPAQHVLGGMGDTGNPNPGAYHLHFMLKSEGYVDANDPDKGSFKDPYEYLTRVGITVPRDTGNRIQARGGIIDVPTPGSNPATISSKISGLYSFHPHIQYELTRRRKSTETANAYTPFVKLTSLVYVMGENTDGGTKGTEYAYCPSLGPHGVDTIRFEDLYTPVFKGVNRSIVGYATREESNGPRLIPVLVSDEDAGLDPPNIPPPGIVSMTTERNTAGAMGVRGGLFRANIKLVAYSVGQLNALLKYYLRPATRVVLEFGRQSSSEYETFAQTEDTSDREFTPFDWNRKLADISLEVENIVRMSPGQNASQERFITKYIYNNFGNYEIYVGYVVNFKLRYTKSNTYEIDLTVHSTQQFEVPVKFSGARAVCSAPNQVAFPSNCGVLDIEDYFNPISSFKQNSFVNLIAKATNVDDELGKVWSNHIIRLNNTNPQEGTGDTTYLVTWPFFINVILRDTKYGLASVFQLNDNPKTLEFLMNSLPIPIGDNTGAGNLDQFLNQYEVGWNISLRSTDAGTMVIDNMLAQDSARRVSGEEIARRNGSLSEEQITNIQNTNVIEQLKEKRLKLGSAFEQSSEGSGISSLVRGVWLNTNAIAQAFTNEDTLAAGLNNLLSKMNAATQGYWNLQILSNDQTTPGTHIVDAGILKPNMQSIRPLDNDLSITGTREKFVEELDRFRQPNTNFPRYLYMFNRKLRRSDSGVTGGELLDINYEASLPQVVAVQAIAGVGGVAQRGTLAAINIEELKQITLYDIYPSCGEIDNGVCPDSQKISAIRLAPNYEALAEVDVRWLTTDYQTSLDPSNPNGASIYEDTKTAVKQAADKRIEQEVRFGNPQFTETELAILKNANTTNYGEESGKNKAAALEQIILLRKNALSEKIDRDIAKLTKELQSTSQKQNSSYMSLVDQYSALYGSAIDLIEYDKSKLMQQLETNRDEYTVHPFNSSNLTKTTIDLTLPGIGGISLFEAFAVDRIPSIAKQGYYIVTRVAQEFSIGQGWTTKITGRFRYNPTLKTEETTKDATVIGEDPVLQQGRFIAPGVMGTNI